MNENELQLCNETDFIKYIELLGRIAKDYTVLVAAHDTPCGDPAFTAEAAAALCRALGTRTLLHDKFRYSYAAVIHKGAVRYESGSYKKVIEYKCKIHGAEISVGSANFNLKVSLGTFYAHYPEITIAGRAFATPLQRGLTIVVFDMVNNIELDVVHFDTYDSHKSSGRSFKFRNALDDFTSQHPNVVFVNFQNPQFIAQNMSSRERYMYDNGITFEDMRRAPANPRYAIRDYIADAEGVLEVLSPPEAYIGTDGARHMFDSTGKYVTILGGHRVTANQPATPLRTIYMVGPCSCFGVAARDEGTIASRLQMLLNENAPQYGFIVHNYGYYLWNTNENDELLAILHSLPLVAGDIVIGPSDRDLLVDLSQAAKRPHNFGEVFLHVMGGAHLTEYGYKLIADKLYEQLSEKKFFLDYVYYEGNLQSPQTDDRQTCLNFLPQQLERLEQYKSTLSAFYDSIASSFTAAPRVGAIVMNCNPFTLGHRYLIETCAAKVDLLIVFVVSEDRSVFPFGDRIKLVDSGISDLPNVGVIESGEFIISTTTFTEYFNKAELQDVIIDASEDVTIFAQEIAPAAHISVRFAGSEPFDSVTRQYNKTLAHILPQYGIEFEELPRKEQGSEAISASRVRRLLEQANFEEIAKLVPPTTLEYLKARFQSD
jgi:[citrate (pro-3S)-lyase] ligase